MSSVLRCIPAFLTEFQIETFNRQKGTSDELSVLDLQFWNSPNRNRTSSRAEDPVGKTGQRYRTAASAQIQAQKDEILKHSKAEECSRSITLRLPSGHNARLSEAIRLGMPSAAEAS